MQVFKAEMCTRVLEEDSARWCAEVSAGGAGAGVGGARAQLLQRKLDRLESEANRMQRKADDNKAYAQASELKDELASEIHVVHKASAGVARARVAEAQMIQNAFTEVQDSRNQGSAAKRQGQEFTVELKQLEQMEKVRTEELDDLKREVLRRAAQEQNKQSATGAGNMSLQSMVGSAASVLGDSGTGNVPHALEALMAASGTPRTRDQYVVPSASSSSLGARGGRPPGRGAAGDAPVTGGEWDTPTTGGLSNQASSLRAQAEGLRGEMLRFQNSRKAGPFGGSSRQQ